MTFGTADRSRMLLGLDFEGTGEGKSMNDQRLNPTERRLVHLDVVRGFALLGILLVNFEWFNRPIQAIVLGGDAGTGLDLVASGLITVLAEGKFYPLFSMLFGAGFALMAERALERDAPFWGVYLRRLLLLALFGLAHMLLIWSGDILLVYALTAFVMVALFRKTPARRLWKWALAFIALPILLMWLGTASIELSRLDSEVHGEVMANLEQDEAGMREHVDRAAEVHAHGSWSENVGQRSRDMAFLFGFALFWIPPILGFFLIGRWLIVSGRLTSPERHRAWFRRWRTLGFGLGLPLAVIAAWLMADANMMQPTLAVAAGGTLAATAGVLMPLGYLSALTLGARRLAFLAPAGQMALTNYLLQSTFWTWMIYGYGFGLWGQIPRSVQLVLAVAFFAVQVLVSGWWLGRFRYGPAEWLWRSLTYWRLQPMRRRSISS